MRILWILPFILALCAFVIPWCTIFLPYAAFRLYVHDSRMRYEEPHVFASLESVFKMSISMQCELVPAFVPFLCDLPKNTDTVLPTFNELRIAQRIFTDEAVRLSPPPQACVDLQAFVRTAQRSDPSAQDDSRDAYAVLETNKIALEACESFAALLQHIELALCRSASIIALFVWVLT